MHRRSFLLGLAAIAASAKARHGHGAADSSLEVAVDAIAAAALSERSIPGLSVVVARRGKVALAKGYGYADLEAKAHASPETVYQIGSISKQFTAAAVMRLAERGKLGLDDPLTKYLPDYPTRGHRVLIRHLLHQTSGIREFFTVRGFDEMEAGAPEKYSRQALVDLFKKEPFVFAPAGHSWTVVDTGGVVAGGGCEIMASPTRPER
ncbi:MAG TPA: serine hydrolase domain-containing protein [Pyrinomonadaceae bacterium]|jgi:CubicO group peptidase (beta-lactamase class C family)